MVLTQNSIDQTMVEENKQMTESATEQKPLERTESVTSSELQDQDILNNIERRGLEMDSPTGSELDRS